MKVSRVANSALGNSWRLGAVSGPSGVWEGKGAQQRACILKLICHPEEPISVAWRSTAINVYRPKDKGSVVVKNLVTALIAQAFNYDMHNP